MKYALDFQNFMMRVKIDTMRNSIRSFLSFSREARGIKR